MEKYQQSNEELCLAAQNGDFKAFDILLQNNYKTIRMIAYHLWSQQKVKNMRLGVTVDELFQIGCEGVWNCIPLYNPERGAKFSTYARICAKNQILDYLKQQKETQSAEPLLENVGLMDYLDGEPLISPALDPQNAFIQKETVQEFNHFLTKLPPREQEFFRSWTGMDQEDAFRSQRELSERHCLSKGEVKKMQKQIGCYFWECLFTLWPRLPAYTGPWAVREYLEEHAGDDETAHQEYLSYLERMCNYRDGHS